ncbi:hypothetical protein [Azospirillum sp. ST 5-10]|uniref:hypothetical protein n=1 Tax=unclassified Azospirillum TaxID=2630922 RepID=UPI003F49E808
MPKTTDPVALNDWYAVGFAADITAATPRRTTLLGQPIVVACDAAGALVGHEVPEDGPPAPIPHLAERYGFVWASLGAQPGTVVDVPELEAPDGRRFLHRGRIRVPISAPRIVENFFDLSHFSFVHTGTLGGYASAEVPKYEVEFRRDGRELWAVGCSFVQPKASAAAVGGARPIYYDYRVPSAFIAIIYKDSLVRPGRKDLIGLFIQPETEELSTVHSFALLYDESNRDTDILHFYHEIFAQDRAIMIHQTPKTLPVGPAAEVPTVSDANSVAFRRWVDRSGLSFCVHRAA